MITERCPPPDWDEPDEIESGEASAVALTERVAYLMAVAASSAAGSQFSPREAARLRQLCHDLDLPEAETLQVLAAAGRAGAMTRHAEEPRSNPNGTRETARDVDDRPSNTPGDPEE